MVCYDCQLANIESLILESIRIDRKVLMLIAKILPYFKYYICTGFEISGNHYSNKENEYKGTGQGNIFLEEVYKVKSCRVIKYLENQNLGINIELLITKQFIQWLANVFVDNISFYSSGKTTKHNIEYIINEYTTLCEVTGGLIEKNKSNSYG